MSSCDRLVWVLDFFLLEGLKERKDMLLMKVSFFLYKVLGFIVEEVEVVGVLIIFSVMVKRILIYFCIVCVGVVLV